MKKLSIHEAGINFGKEWLLPKLGTAYAVYQVTSIALKDAIKSPNPDGAYAPYLNLINGIGDFKIMSVFFIVAALIISGSIAAYIALDKAPGPILQRFIEARSWVHVALSFVLGMVLVPLAVWCAALFSLGNPWSAWFPFAMTAFTYVIVGFALYWLKLEETTDSIGNVSWIVTLKPKQRQSDATKFIDEYFESVKWIGDCEITSNSKDGTVVLEVPVKYSYKIWSDTEIRAFGKLLKDSTEFLKIKGFIVSHRLQSDSVKKALDRSEKKALKKIK